MTEVSQNGNAVLTLHVGQPGETRTFHLSRDMIDMSESAYFNTLISGNFKTETEVVLIQHRADVFVHLVTFMQGYELDFGAMSPTEIANIRRDAKYFLMTPLIRYMNDQLLTNNLTRLSYITRNDEIVVDVNDTEATSELRLEEAIGMRSETLFDLHSKAHKGARVCLYAANFNQRTRLAMQMSKVFEEGCDFLPQCVCAFLEEHKQLKPRKYVFITDRVQTLMVTHNDIKYRIKGYVLLDFLGGNYMEIDARTLEVLKDIDLVPRTGVFSLQVAVTSNTIEVRRIFKLLLV